jgi:hypothetical protein
MQKMLVNYNCVKELDTWELFLGENKSSAKQIVRSVAFFSLSLSLESEFCELMWFCKWPI